MAAATSGCRDSFAAWGVRHVWRLRVEQAGVLHGTGVFFTSTLRSGIHWSFNSGLNRTHMRGIPKDHGSPETFIPEDLSVENLHEMAVGS